MENKTDNAIVQEAAVENTAPNAEIKKKRGRKPKNAISQEVKSPDVDGKDEIAAVDEASVDVEKDYADVSMKEAIQDLGGDAENGEADANMAEAIQDMCGDAAADSNNLADTTNAGHTVDVAEAMRRIISFTEEMRAEVEAEAEADIHNDTSLSEEKEPSEKMTDSRVSTDNEDHTAGVQADLDGNGKIGDDKDNTNILQAEADGNTHENADSFDIPDISENSGTDADMADEIVPEAVDRISDPTDSTPIESHDTSSGEDTDDDDKDEEYGIEDEFDSIPDSYFDDEFSYPEDDNSSISALLYNDDDDRVTDNFEKRDSISFSDIKEQMQRIKNEATELRADEDDEIHTEEIAEELTDVGESEPTEDEPMDLADTEDNGDIIEEKPEDEQEEATPTPEKKSYIRDIDRGEEIEETPEPEECRGEHIITIDRSRIKENTVPEGRLIDIVFDAVEMFTFALIIIMILLSFVFRHTTVSGPSMLPTFHDGDRLITSNLFYEPKRGDVVVFDDRSNEAYDDIPIIKRIIGLEGDVVKIEGGIIMVKENGEDEFKIVNYVEDMEIPYRDMEEVTVGKGEMFVMGDNVNNSFDSTDRDENDPLKNVGNIKTDSIIGKVLFRFYTVETVFSEETQEWVKKGRIVFDTKFTLE